MSITVPSIWPLSTPALIRTLSPTANGRASISTMPANTLLNVCCAAMPIRTAVNAPPRMRLQMCTRSIVSVMSRLTSPPTSTIAYLTTAAWAEPIPGSRVSRALPDRPIVAARANRPKAIAQATLTSSLTGWPARVAWSFPWFWSAAHTDAAAAIAASTSAMYDRTRPGPRPHLGHLPGHVELILLPDIHGPTLPSADRTDPGDCWVPGITPGWGQYAVSAPSAADERRAHGQLQSAAHPGGYSGRGGVPGDRDGRLCAEDRHVEVEDREAQQDPTQVIGHVLALGRNDEVEEKEQPEPECAVGAERCRAEAVLSAYPQYH